MTTAERLTASRDAHATYRRVHDDAAKRKAPKPSGWQQHLWDALHLRLEAHDLDPTHADPAWSDDLAPHAELVSFYRRQLGLVQNGTQ